MAPIASGAENRWTAGKPTIQRTTPATKKRSASIATNILNVIESEDYKMSANYDLARLYGVVIENEITVGNGYAMFTVMPLDFTTGASDPSGESALCYLRPSEIDGIPGAMYILEDGAGNQKVFLNDQMEPIAFQIGGRTNYVDTRSIY